MLRSISDTSAIVPDGYTSFMHTRPLPFCALFSDNLSKSLLRDRSLFMAGMGTEEKALRFLKKILPHHLLMSNSLYPTGGKQ